MRKNNMSILKRISERSFANISLSNMALVCGLETTNKRKAVTKRSTYKRTFLTSADIRIFLVLHFLANSIDGTAKMIQTADLAEVIHVDYKTVLASYKRLQEMNLITVSAVTNSDMDLVNLTITGYENMFLKRGEGGSGYFTMTLDFLSMIVDIKNINKLRILLRLTAQTATDELNSAAKQATSLITFEEIRRGLPAYIKPGVIRHAFDSVKNVFEDIEYIGKRLKVTLREEYQGRIVKEKIHEAANKKIGAFVHNLNLTTTSANLEIHSAIKQAVIKNGYFVLSENIVNSFKDLGIEISARQYAMSESEYWTARRSENSDDENEGSYIKNIPSLNLTPSDIRDSALLAQDYGIEAVLSAIKRYYELYILGPLKLPKYEKGIGGLLRTILRDQKSLSFT